MTLLDTIRRLPELDAQEAIYASKPWLLSSAAVVTREPRDRSLPAEAHRNSCVFFLDVVVARAFLIGWRAVHKREPSADELCYSLIDFAIDYPEPGAAPNVGPAASLASSEVGEGPPSVS